MTTATARPASATGLPEQLISYDPCISCATSLLHVQIEEGPA